MRVLISGAGIAGPTLAFFLAKTGAQITVLERSASLLKQGHNIDIEGSAIKVVEKMGVLSEIRRLNTTEKGTRFIGPDGRAFAPFPVKEGQHASPTSELEILRGDLASILYEATKDHPNVKYCFGTVIRKIVSNDEKTVKVELSNDEIQEYDLLVAADGQWSKVRKQCFPAHSVQVVDKNMYVAYSTVPREECDTEWWNIYQALNSRVLTTRPDPHGTLRATFTVMPLNPTQKQSWEEVLRADRPAQQKLLRQEFTDAGWHARRFLNEMEKAPDFYLQAVQQIRMDTWSSNRVVCVGDAAFAPTPLSGMGTSLALIASYVLAGELSKVDNNAHPGPALEQYEKVLRPLVTKTQDIPWFAPGIVHPRTAWQRWLFGVFVSAVAKVVATAWFANKFGGESDDGFPLPRYDAFDDGEELKQ